MTTSVTRQGEFVVIRNRDTKLIQSIRMDTITGVVVKSSFATRSESFDVHVFVLEGTEDNAWSIHSSSFEDAEIIANAIMEFASQE
jgi:hypothetical protein